MEFTLCSLTNWYQIGFGRMGRLALTGGLGIGPDVELWYRIKRPLAGTLAL